MAFGDLKVQDLIYEDGSNNEITVVLANLVVRDGSGDLVQADNKKFIAGTGSDLQIYHNGTHSFINNSTGNLNLQTSGNVWIENQAGSEVYIKAIANGTVQLYYDNSKKLETASYGVDIPDTLRLSGGWADYGTQMCLGCDSNGVAYTAAYTLVFRTGANNSRTTTLELDASNNAIFAGDVDLADNKKIKLGTGDDLQIYHDGSNTYIYQNGTGELRANTATFRVMDRNGGETQILASENGAVELYYDNSKKFETSSYGVWLGDNSRVTLGGSAGTPDCHFYHDATNTNIQNITGDLIIKSNSDGDKAIVVKNGAAVELYYDNSKKFETSSTGVTVNGAAVVGGNIEINTDAYLKIGASNDLQIFHNGSHSYIEDSGTGNLYIRSSNTRMQSSAGEDQIILVENGAVELYYDNSKKLETTSGGVNVVGALTVNGSALAGGGFASVQYFTSSGTWTKPSGIKIIRVTVLGGGGGGGKSNGIYNYGGNGGGGGGLSQKIIDVTSISSETVTIGAGGSNTSSYGGNGGAGGSSSFGSHCSASGGSGGTGNVSGTSASGATTAGVGSSGNINLRGGYGSIGIRGQNYTRGGTGGASPLWGVDSPGGLGQGGGSIVTPGSGGGGAGGGGTSNTGGAGFIVVEEFK